MTGNIVHCLRSALDYLVRDLVLLNGCEPTTGPGGNQFPIFRDRPTSRGRNPATFAARTAGTLVGVHPDHQAMIEWLQPMSGLATSTRARTP